MPQNVKIITPEYAKSFYGFVIDNTLPFGTQAKLAYQQLTVDPPQIEITPDPDPIAIDLDPPIDPDLPTVEQDPLLGQVEIIRTGGNIPPIFPNVQPQGQPPAIDGEGNLVG